MESEEEGMKKTQSNPTVPEEIITEILSRLQVKSLLRFRSVSKLWLALISSPQFIKTHHSTCLNNKDYTHHMLLGLVYDGTQFNLLGFSLNSFFDGPVAEKFNFNYLQDTSGFRTCVGSVNGLICIRFSVAGFLLCNPSIRTMKKLPDCHFHSHKTYSSYRYGFGYDESHDDYIVVSTIRNIKEDGSQCVEGRMYSLRSDMWSSVDDLHDKRLLHDSCLVNGKLHWGCQNGFGEITIMSLGLANKRWGMVEKAPRGERDMGFCLGVLRSDLSVIYHDISSRHASVWVMKEYGVEGSWIKMFTIKYHNNDPISRIYRGFHPPFFLSSKGELLLKYGKAVMIYNPEDESTRYLELSNLAFGVEEYIYTESLVCPLLLSEQIMQQGRRLQKLR